MGLDFFIIFSQSLLFSLASFYINAPNTYIPIFIVLLAFDVIWTVYSRRPDGDMAASPQRMWLLNNLVAGTVLIVLFLAIYKVHDERVWARDAALVVLAATTVIDFSLNWRFYFPGSTKKWHAGQKLAIFLAAPLTQFVDDGDLSKMDDFRADWGGIAELLERNGHEVISAHRREAWGADINPADKALRADLSGLQASELLVAYVGRPPSPGVQLELGYALAHHKKIMGFLYQDQDVPYLVRGLPDFPNVELFDISHVSDVKDVLYHRGLIEIWGSS